MFHALVSFGKNICFAEHLQVEHLSWNDLLVRMRNRTVWPIRISIIVDSYKKSYLYVVSDNTTPR